VTNGVSDVANEASDGAFETSNGANKVSDATNETSDVAFGVSDGTNEVSDAANETLETTNEVSNVANEASDGVVEASNMAKTTVFRGVERFNPDFGLVCGDTHSLRSGPGPGKRVGAFVRTNIFTPVRFR